MWFKIVAACVPAIIVEVAFGDNLEKWFYNYKTVAIMLILIGIVFIIVEEKNKKNIPSVNKIGQITYTTAFWIGMFQLVAAVFPGTSRSGATIIGGLILGLSRTVAAEFTFYLAIPVMFLAVIGTVNGVNFTDGLDGLASSVTVLVATFFTVVAVGTHSGIEPITCAVVGALMGFLLFNVYPAKVFMGDTGSLALGGFVAASAYMMQMPIFILIVGLIYWIEILSVMIQVTYFKKTGGKRIFKMAPIHHHFELCGWSETRVVAVFSIATAILCLIGLLAL